MTAGLLAAAIGHSGTRRRRPRICTTDGRFRKTGRPAPFPYPPLSRPLSCGGLRCSCVLYGERHPLAAMVRHLVLQLHTQRCPAPANGARCVSRRIAHHYFSLIILNFNDTTQADAKIIADMQQAGNYQVIDVVPSSVGQFTIWAYQPPKPSASVMAATEHAVYRSGPGRHRRYGLGLPAAPSDTEKTGYADRNLALIIRTSLASFGALLISQVRFVFLNAAFTWVFLPFVVFTVAYYAHLPVC